MTTLIKAAERALANARALEQRVVTLGTWVDSRDARVSEAQKIINDAAGNIPSPMVRREMEE